MSDIVAILRSTFGKTKLVQIDCGETYDRTLLLSLLMKKYPGHTVVELLSLEEDMDLVMVQDSPSLVDV